jgi:hypothetical protein
MPGLSEHRHPGPGRSTKQHRMLKARSRYTALAKFNGRMNVVITSPSFVFLVDDWLAGVGLLEHYTRDVSSLDAEPSVRDEMGRMMFVGAAWQLVPPPQRSVEMSTRAVPASRMCRACYPGKHAATSCHEAVSTVARSAESFRPTCRAVEIVLNFADIDRIASFLTDSWRGVCRAFDDPARSP